MDEYTELNKIAAPAVSIRLSAYDGGPDLTVEWAVAPAPEHVTATAVTLLNEYRAARHPSPEGAQPS